jgi:hypothetical protein
MYSGVQDPNSAATESLCFRGEQTRGPGGYDIFRTMSQLGFSQFHHLTIFNTERYNPYHSHDAKSITKHVQSLFKTKCAAFDVLNSITLSISRASPSFFPLPLCSLTVQLGRYPK